MAGPDPRRSSRARTTQSQSQISSTASSVSGRPDRNARLFNKGGSPQKSTSTGSLSSEPPEDTITAEDPFGTRRRTRGQAEERERAGSKAEAIDMANGEGDGQEEDEAVRCVCGNEEYQGPPPLDEDSKHGFKHTFDLDPFFSADVTDDTAGLFVQCDICKVWQHGGCVGIMTEESSPDEYFCELCRQDLHKLWTASNGSVYSHYLPLKRHARTTSRAASLNKEVARSPTKEKETRSGRNSASNQSSKRRSTLNSREAGYDEAEALRRAIEASKEEAATGPAENGNRRPKRGRSDSQEKPEGIKRQKTSSRSASPLSDKNAEDSDDLPITGRNGASKSSKSRSAAVARNHRSEKPSEKEERERQRAETANKRKNRAERRRAEDSDPSDELPLLASRTAAHKASATTTTITQASSGGSDAAAATATEAAAARPPAAATEPPPSSNPGPDTPPTITVQAKSGAAAAAAAAAAAGGDKKRSHKKKGRNQYTRDRDAADEDSPARSQSRDIQKDEHHHHHQHGSSGGGSGGGGGGGSGGGSGGGGRASGEGTGTGTGTGKGSSRPKGGMSSKITMNDMKRRAAALLDFISRTQVEMAGEAGTGTETTSTSASTSTTGASAAAPVNGVGAGADEAAAVLALVSPTSARKDVDAKIRLPDREFKELDCVEMMDTLTRRLVKWQQQYSG